MEFKKLEVEENKGLKKIIHSQHVKKTLLYIAIGAVAGLAFFYFTEGQHMNEIVVKDIVRSMLIGGFFGFFITNSPCSRGRC